MAIPALAPPLRPFLLPELPPFEQVYEFEKSPLAAKRSKSPQESCEPEKLAAPVAFCRDDIASLVGQFHPGYAEYEITKMKGRENERKSTVQG